MSDFATKAIAIYAAAHPEDAAKAGPQASSLDVAAGRGATPQQAADAAWYFYQNAEFPDGTVYGSSFNCESLDHGGANDGYGYGYSPEKFASSYTVAYATGETPAMREAASKPGLTWEQSLAIDPFLDAAYAKKAAAFSAGTASYASDRISALEAAVFGKK